MGFFSNLFCKHKYTKIGWLPTMFRTEEGENVDVSTSLYECRLCGKRKIIRDSSCFYTPQLLKKLKLWQKHELEYEQF